MMTISKIWKQLNPSDKEYQTKSNQGIFNVKLLNNYIGQLRLEGNTWVFEYSDACKKNDELLPLPGFKDKNMIYKIGKDQLWPFFAARIPTLNQPYHQKKLEGKDSNDLFTLLDTFGRRSINNPFIVEKETSFDG